MRLHSFIHYFTLFLLHYQMHAMIFIIHDGMNKCHIVSTCE